MDKKFTLGILGILGFIIFPVKVILELVNSSLVRTTTFALIFSACVFLAMLFSAFLYEKKEKEYLFRNMPLTVISAACCFLYLWSSFCYFRNPAPSDSKVKYFLVAIFFALSSLFFLFVFCAHFRNKNMFKKAQIIVYMPFFAYLLSLMLFFSFEIGRPDAYNILAQSLTLLFFVYYSNFYVRCYDKNFKRRCFVFGIPAVFVTLCYSVPNLIRNFEGFNSLNTVLQITYIATSAYIFTFLASDLKNLKNLQNSDRLDSKAA